MSFPSDPASTSTLYQAIARVGSAAMTAQSVDAIKEMLAAEGTGLFHLVHQFNVHPAAYAHPSWFEPYVPPEIFRRLQKSRRGVSRLSKMLLREKKLCRDTCYVFDSPWWRFALLPANVLLKLTRYCGLASMHRQISAIVDRNHLSYIKKSLGEKDYLFTIKRAPLLIGREHGIDLRWNGHCDVGQLAGQYGIAYFLSHFREAPRAITARVALKFSRSHEAVAVNRGTGESGWRLFKRILIHEIEPRWQPLFS